MMRTFDGKPLTARVYQHILSAIINGVITTNDILTESRLIEELQVSKSPVREALISLCDEGILRSIPRTGYKLIQITPRQVNHLCEARCTLEVSILEKAFPLLTDEKIQQLEDYLETAYRKESSSKLTTQENWQINTDFHLLLASFAENDWLYNLLRQTLETSARAATQYFHQASATTVMSMNGTHPALVKALAKRDFEQAEAVLIDDMGHLLCKGVGHH